MKRKAVFFMAALTSSIVKGTILSYLPFNSSNDAWLGSSAFSTATAIFISSFLSIPTSRNETPPAILYTYYTAMSLLVSILAVRLIWVPVVDLVTEMNMVLSKTLLYVNKSFLYNSKTSLLKQMGIFFGTKTAIVWSTNLLGIFFLYAVSTDVLNYMSLYFYNLPNSGVFAKIRSTALKVIGLMMNALCPKKYVRISWKPQVGYYSTKTGKVTAKDYKDKRETYLDDVNFFS